MHMITNSMLTITDNVHMIINFMLTIITNIRHSIGGYTKWVEGRW